MFVSPVPCECVRLSCALCVCVSPVPCECECVSLLYPVRGMTLCGSPVPCVRVYECVCPICDCKKVRVLLLGESVCVCDFCTLCKSVCLVSSVST